MTTSDKLHLTQQLRHFYFKY